MLHSLPYFSSYWAAVTRNTSNNWESAYQTQHLGMNNFFFKGEIALRWSSYSPCAKKILVFLSPLLSQNLGSFALFGRNHVSYVSSSLFYMFSLFALAAPDYCSISTQLLLFRDFTWLMNYSPTFVFCETLGDNAIWYISFSAYIHSLQKRNIFLAGGDMNRWILFKIIQYFHAIKWNCFNDYLLATINNYCFVLMEREQIKSSVTFRRHLSLLICSRWLVKER